MNRRRCCYNESKRNNPTPRGNAEKEGLSEAAYTMKFYRVVCESELEQILSERKIIPSVGNWSPYSPNEAVFLFTQDATMNDICSRAESLESEGKSVYLIEVEIYGPLDMIEDDLSADWRKKSVTVKGEIQEKKDWIKIRRRASFKS